MAFKINVSHKGKTIKFEVENEDLVGTIIGDKIAGKDVDASLEGYELMVTGTSDKAGFPGLPKVEGPRLQGVLLTYGLGMRKKPKGEHKRSTKPKGLRLRKSVRGNEISLDTVQINIKVVKEGSGKFDSLLPKKEGEEKREDKVEKSAEAPKETEKKEEVKEDSSEKKPEGEEKPSEEKK
jgi:small subunit ribosomal protein S6e